MEDLASLEKVFNDNKVAALAQPQNDSFLSLASIYMDPETLKIISSTTKTGDDDDDDDYLNDDKGNKAVKQWLDNVEKLKSSYISSNQELQSNVRKIECQKLGLLDLHSLEDNNDAADNSFIELSCHMNNVMIEAFSKQLQDMYQSKTPSSSIALDGKYLTSEFEKSKSRYDNLLKLAEDKAKAKLEARKKKFGLSKVLDNSKDDDYDDDLGLSSVVSTFLRNPRDTKITSPEQRVLVVGGVSHSNSGSGKKVLAPLNRLPSIKLNGKYGNDNEDEADRSRIVSLYADKEKKLVEGLQAQMYMKKQILEERLQKKKEQRAKASADGDTYKYHSDDIAIEELEIAKLEEAFKNVVTLVKNADNRQLNNVDINTLVSAMDKVANGEFLPTLSAAAVAVQYSTDEVNRTATHTTTLTEFGEKQLMQDEVKNICAVYSEEKQKHDLIMKLQQTRQRQNLQRKLMERKKDSSNSNEVRGLGSMGNMSREQALSDSKDVNQAKAHQERQVRGLHLTPIRRGISGNFPMEQLL